MFEVGFTEIILILGIALLVLGPERLPKVAAEVGRWMGRARAMARQLKSQLDDEVHRAERTFTEPEPPRASPPPAATTAPDTPPPPAAEAPPAPETAGSATAAADKPHAP